MALQKRKIALDTRNYNFDVTIKFGPGVDPAEAKRLQDSLAAAIDAHFDGLPCTSLYTAAYEAELDAEYAAYSAYL